MVLGDFHCNSSELTNAARCHPPLQAGRGPARAARAEHQRVGALLHRPLLPGHSPPRARPVCWAGAAVKGRRFSHANGHRTCLLPIRTLWPLPPVLCSSLLATPQIALDPPTMGVVGGGIDAQCVRCLLRWALAALVRAWGRRAIRRL